MLKPTILIVESAEEERRHLCAIFYDEYRVLEASGGAKAMEVLDQEKVDLMVLEMDMPDMDGFEVLTRLRKLPQNCDIPVVAKIKNSADEMGLRALEAGAADFIPQPYHDKILHYRVVNILKKALPERNRLQKNLDEANQQLKALVDTVPGGIATFSLAPGTQCYFNDSFYIICGYTKEEYEQLTRDNYMVLVYPEDRPLIKKAIERAKADFSPIKVSYRIHKKDGTTAWLALSAVCYKIEDGCPVYHAVFTDQTEEKKLLDQRLKMMKKLEYEAEHDMLTGVYNREAFCRITEKKIRENPGSTYGVICWDIRNFKIINERFGNHKGDEVLKALAQNLVREAGEDGICGRLGGDRFACCLPWWPSRVEELKAQILEWDTQQELGCRFALYFGVYHVEDPSIPADQMCDRAMIALRSIKGSSVYRYAVYDEHMMHDLQAEQEIESEMEAALANREFKLYLQPIYSSTTGLPVCAEALVRWQHPRRGMIPPGDFIPLFERNGFITRLDAYIWEEACRFLSERQADMRPFTSISVNLSRLDLEDEALPLTLKGLIDRYGLNPAMLKLEITESAYTDNPQQLKDVVIALQKQGFTVLMDDFGSGYSSLNMLKDLPVDVLKIDMRFLEDLEVSARAGNVLNSVVHMAKWLRMEVVAEGVETRQQVDFLRGIGCDKIQGYYYSRPLSIENFAALLEEHQVKGIEERNINLEEYDFDNVWNASKESSLLFNGIVGAMGVYELRGEVLDALRVNDGYFELYGGSLQDFYRNSHMGFDSLYEEDRKELLHICCQAEQDRKPKQTIIRRAHSDGRRLICDVRLRYLGKNDGNPLFCITSFDVTAQQENQRTLYLQQYTAVLRNVYTDIYEINYTDGTSKTIFSKQQSNDEEAQDLEKRLEKVDFWRVHPQDREEYCRLFDGEILEEEIKKAPNHCISTTARVLGKDGVYHWRRRTLFPLENQAGKKTYLSCMATIDAEKRSEELLEEAAAMEAVRWERERYLEVMQQTGVIVFEWNLEKHTFQAEKGFEGFTLSLDDPWAILRKKVRKGAIYAGDWQQFEHFFENNEKEHYHSIQTELRLQKHDGSYHWCRLTSNILRDEKGRPRRVIGTINLIDRQKKAEQNAMESEEMLASIIKNLPVGIFVAECENGITPKFISGKAGEILGCRTKAHQDCKMHADCPIGSIWQKTLFDAIERLNARSCEKDAAETFEKQFAVPRGKGEPIWIQVAGVVCRNDESKLHAYCAITDITELQNTKTALQGAIFELEHLLDQLPVGVGIYELGQEKIRTRYLNEQVYKILNIPKIENKKIDRCYDYEPGQRAELDSLMEGKQQRVLTDRVFSTVKSDGTPFWLRKTTSILKQAKGNPLCYAVLSDITRQEELERDYRRQNELYMLLMRNSEMLILDYDIQKDRLTYSLKNAHSERIKYTVENVMTRLKQPRIIHHDYIRVCADVIHTASEKPTSGNIEYRADHFGTGYQWYRTSFISIADKDGAPYRIVGMGEDITKEKQLQDHLSREQDYRQTAMMETLFATETDVMEKKIKVIHVSERSGEYYPALEYFAQGGERHIHPKDRARIMKIFSPQNMNAAFQRGNNELRAQFRIERRDGSWVWVEAVTYLLHEEAHKTLRALTYIRLVEKERELRERAEIDPVTKIYNRATLQEKIRQVLLSGEGDLAFAICDIDDFKRINDTQGHRKGDEALETLAKLLCKNFRKQDIIGRLGGDEFVVLMREVKTRDDAAKRVERLLTDLHRGQAGKKFSLSVGVALQNSYHESFETLYERADRVLYAAKENGKNQYQIEKNE